MSLLCVSLSFSVSCCFCIHVKVSLALPLPWVTCWTTVSMYKDDYESFRVYEYMFCVRVCDSESYICEMSVSACV